MATKYLTVSRLRLKRIVKLFSKILIDPSIQWNGTPCWNWLGSKSGDGYGFVGYNSKVYRTHQLFYAWAVAPIPSYEETNLTIDHLCRNRACCNPIHLDLVPHWMNSFRVRQQVCKNGHEISGANAYVVPCRPKSSPQCLICKRATLRRIYDAKKNDTAFKTSEKQRRREKYLKYGY